MRRYRVNFTIERRVRSGGRKRLERANFAGLEVVAVDRNALTAEVLAAVKTNHPGYKLSGYSIIWEREETT